MEFCKRLKQLRLEKRMTQIELGNFLGVKPTTISNYESGRNQVDYDKLKKLAKHFDVSVDYLLGASESIFPISSNSIDKEFNEFWVLYNSLNEKNKIEVKNYAEWLIHKQQI